MGYTNHPRECDELLESICKDYRFVSADYPTAWTFREYLKLIRPCDYSDIEEDISFDNNEMVFVRIIFFTCQPSDMDRLAFIAKNFHWLRNWEWQIIDDKGGIVYESKNIRRNHSGSNKCGN